MAVSGEQLLATLYSHMEESSPFGPAKTASRTLFIGRRPACGAYGFLKEPLIQSKNLILRHNYAILRQKAP